MCVFKKKQIWKKIVCSDDFLNQNDQFTLRSSNTQYKGQSKPINLQHLIMPFYTSFLHVTAVHISRNSTALHLPTKNKPDDR